MLTLPITQALLPGQPTTRSSNVVHRLQLSLSMEKLRLSLIRIAMVSTGYLFVIQTVTVYAQNQCLSLFSSESQHQRVALRDAQREWGPSHFSRPENFDPEHFRFIVHAGPHVIDGSGDRDVLELFLERALSYDFNAEKFFSASIVSEKQTATFNTSGFILDVPEQKIIAATSQDMRSSIESPAEAQVTAIARKFYSREGLKTPDEILQNASHTTDFYGFGLDWTEVLVNGTARNFGKLWMS